jgi:hypothetical protein
MEDEAAAEDGDEPPADGAAEAAGEDVNPFD